MLVNRIIFSLDDHPQYAGISLYFQGCDATPKCPKCHNPETWDFDENYIVNYEIVRKKITNDISFLLSAYPKVGFSFLGGEPLALSHRGYVSLLSMDLRYIFKDKIDMVLYSWRTPEEIHKENLMKHLKFIDRFVLGKFDYTQLNTDSEGNVLFPASKNQKVLTYEELEKYIKKNV